MKVHSKSAKKTHTGEIDKFEKKLESNREVIEYYIVPKELRVLPDHISTVELTRVISERCSQLEHENAVDFLTDEERANLTTVREIAVAEIKLRKCPLNIERPRSNNRAVREVWSVNELILPGDI